MKGKFESELNAFEEQMKVLRALFERFFLGLERLPPVRERERLTRALRNFEVNPPTSTPDLFRFQALKATWISYEAYWTRRLRGREDTHSLKSASPAHAKDLALPKPASTASTQVAFAPEMLQKLQARWQELAQKHGREQAPTLEVLQKDLQAQFREARKKYPGQKLEVKLATSDNKTQLAVTPKV